MFCKHCGKEVKDGVKFCPSCGGSIEVVDGTTQTVNTVSNGTSDEPKASVGIIIASILIPLVGIIMYFVKRGSEPKNAKTYLTIGLVMWVINIILLNV